MAVFSGVLALTTAAQPLSNVAGAPGNRFRQVFLQAGPANAGVMRFGSNTATLTTVTYGFRIEVPATSIPDPPLIIEGSTSLVSLTEISVIGTTTTDRLHIWGVTA